MAPDSPEQRAFEQYDELVALDGAARAARLAALKASDPAAADLLARMLAASGGTDLGSHGSMLDGIAANAAQTLQHALAEPAEQRVGPFMLLRLLGRGGMGEVWLAERAEVDFEQRVALKLVRPGLDDGEFDARFLRERRILARLDHPQLAALVDGGVTRGGRPWFAMRYIDGLDINAYAAAARLDLRARMTLLAELSAAAGHAHALGIVHRDIKPSNVLVPADGKPVLIDFGIARLFADDEGTLTRTQHSPMSPAYAAPEQLRHGPIGPWTDVYALALIGWELIVGRRARESGTLASNPTGTTTTPGEAWREQSPDRRGSAESPDSQLDRIFARALADDPTRRHPDGTALARDLQSWLDGRPLDAGTRASSPGPRSAGTRVRMLAIAVSIACVIGGLGWFATRSGPEGTSSTEAGGATAVAAAAASLDATQQAAYLRAVGLASVGDINAREAALPPLRALVTSRPDFLPALDLLSNLLADLAWHQRISFDAALAEQRELAATAERSSPGSIEARALSLVADFGEAQARPDHPAYVAVLARARELMDMAPRRLDVLLIATDSSGVLGRLDDVVVLARRAEALAPHDERAIIMLARALYSLGRHDDADAAAARARALSPRRGETYDYAYSRYAEIGQFGRAWATIEACRAAGADRCEQFVGRLGFLLRQGDPPAPGNDPLFATFQRDGIEAAIAALEAQGPDQVRRRAIDVMSWALHSRRPQIAIDVLGRRSPALLAGAQPLPHETDFSLLHGIALHQLGRDEEARAAFGRVLTAIEVLPHATRSALPQLPDVGALAWLGREDEALARLAAYVEAGWSGERALTEARGGIVDPMISPLAESPEFRSLIERVRARNAEAAAALPATAFAQPGGG